jgi:hypothetical protein
MNLTLEGGYVGWYFPLERKLFLHFHVKESEWMTGLGKWTQVMWNQARLFLRQWHSLECEMVVPMSVQDQTLPLR